jgi:hypothetical protein
LSFFVVIACRLPDKGEAATEESDVQSSFCLDGTYPLTLQVWSSTEEEDNFVETEPLCEHSSEITLISDLIEGAFECEFERGNQTRVLSYTLAGQKEEGVQYTGTVLFTRGNGEEEDSSFSGHCIHEERLELHFEWYLVFETPNGVREHHAVLSNEEL